MRIQKLSLIFLLAFIYQIISEPFCGVDELLKNTTIQGISLTQKKDKSKKRNLQSNQTEETYHGLETEIIYDYINGLYTMSDTEGEYYANTTLILTRVQKILNSILKVKNENKITYNNPSIPLCGQDNLKDINISSNADYVLIAQYSDKLAESTIASASPCVYDQDNNKRPIIGKVNININYDFSKYNVIPYYVKVFLHEIFHALGFIEPSWTDTSSGIPLTYKVINGKNYTLISSTKVLEMARKHFNCDTLEGVPIEGDGGNGTAGSHWDMTFMQADFMIGISEPENVISEITLALFEDLNWYKANYYTGGLFKFGKNQGCDFFSKKCVENGVPNFNEFCAIADDKACLKQGYSWGKCYLYSGTINCSTIPNFQYISDDNFSTCKIGLYNYNNFCPIVQEVKFSGWNLATHCKYGQHPETSIFEETPQLYGNNSICIEGNLTSLKGTYPGQTKWGGCFEIECDKVNKKIKVKVENNEFICNSTSEKIIDVNKYNGELNCPDYNDFCMSTVFCNDLEDCVYAKSFREDFGLYTEMNILGIINAPTGITNLLKNDYVNFTFSQNGSTFVNSNGLDANINIRLKYKNDSSYIDLKPISCYFKSASDDEMNCMYDLRGKNLKDGSYFFQITNYEDRLIEINDKTVIINEWESQEINFMRNYPLLISNPLDININLLNKKEEGIYEFKVEFDNDLSLLTPLPTIYEFSDSDPLNCTIFEENTKMLTCLINLSSKNLDKGNVTVNLIAKSFQSNQYNNVINLNYLSKTINIIGMTNPYSGCNYLKNKIFSLDFNIINADSKDQGTVDSLVYFKNTNTEKKYYSGECTLSGENSSITCQFDFTGISSEDLSGIYQIIPQDGKAIENIPILSSFKSELFGLSSTVNVVASDNQNDFEFTYDENNNDNYKIYIQFEDNLNDYIPIVTLKDSNDQSKVLNCTIDCENNKSINCEIIKSDISISEGETKKFSISIENECKMTENVDMDISITKKLKENVQEEEKEDKEEKGDKVDNVDNNPSKNMSNAFSLSLRIYFLVTIFILLFL